MRLKIATENGRRIGRTSKAKRLAAQPATDAARLMRAIGVIRAEAEKAYEQAKHAETIAEAAFLAASGDDRLLARALAREAVIEGRGGRGYALIVRFCEMAEEGTLCA